MLPRKLSVHKQSPNYNADAIKKVDKVFVDGKLIENCYAYDMDQGWAMRLGDNGVWQPKVYGTVRVTQKP